MQIIDNKALRLRVRSGLERFRVIPKHFVEDVPGGHEVTVFWGLDETRVLKNLGFRNVPSPIERTYDWPGRWRPMDHQRTTAGFLTLHRRAFCFNDPGTGKTLSALWAADYLMKRGEVRRTLIVCPLSIMQTAWMGDITSSVLHRSAAIAHHAKASRRIEIIQGDYEFVIINYDGLKLVANEIKADERFDLVIVDEANAYANPSTDRWKALASIVGPETFLWMMTGTPAAQSPEHAYGLARLVCPSNVPKFAGSWKDKVMLKISTFKWIPKPDAKQIVFDALQPAVRFAKEDCLDLPPVMKETRFVPLTAQQAKYYEKLKNDQLVIAAGEVISAVNKAALVNKLLQVSCGGVYSENGQVVEFDATPRFNLLREVLEETDRKVLIFAMFRSSIDGIATYIERHGIKVGVIHGGVTATKRAALITDFQTQPHIQVLVMQPQATAHGITLTAADTVVFFGPVMSVELYLQCIARSDRKGQTSDKVRVIHIQSSPVEKRMFDAMDGRVTDHAILSKMFDEEMEAKIM